MDKNIPKFCHYCGRPMDFYLGTNGIFNESTGKNLIGVFAKCSRKKSLLSIFTFSNCFDNQQAVFVSGLDLEYEWDLKPIKKLSFDEVVEMRSNKYDPDDKFRKSIREAIAKGEARE